MSTPRVPDDVILVVEDDVSIREIVTAILEDGGYKVAAAENGSLALRWLRSHPAPCLILLDLWMPVMTGEEFRSAQLSDPCLAPIPVVVITAVRDGEERAAALGVQGFLQKPIALASLIKTVQRHCSQPS